MLFHQRLFKLSTLSLALVSHFSFAGNDSELNLDFLQGMSTIPSVLKSGSDYPAGQLHMLPRMIIHQHRPLSAARCEKSHSFVQLVIRHISAI